MHGSSGWIVNLLDATFEAWLTSDAPEAVRSAVNEWLVSFLDGLPEGAELVYPDSHSRYYASDYFVARCWTQGGTVEARFFVNDEERIITITQLLVQPPRSE